ncbi:MAG: hypothetical protein ABSA30_08990 [Candidatus Aminicenantales bacterium]|jgi:uncharacterized membrane protein (DUF106 family)
MFAAVQSVWGAVFGVFFLPFRALGPWAAMAAVSLLTGLLMLFIFKKTSNQAGILRTKNLIKAHLLEIRLFKSDFGQTMRSQGRILLANGRYLGYAVKPMLVMLVPILLLLLQLDAWYGARSLRPGETAIVKVRLDGAAGPLRTPLSIEAPAGLTVETPALRIEEEKEIDWRIRADTAGIHELTFALDGGTFTKTVAVGQLPLKAKIVPLRVRNGGWDALNHPCEALLPSGLPVVSVEVEYPPARLNLFGWRMHWLVAYFLLSMVFGFGLKGVFKVEI